VVTTVLLAALWNPPQLDQKKREITKLTSPAMSTITPTVWMFTPCVVAVTAQIKIAPTALTSKLAVTPISNLHGFR
jgi:hypothetical protein